MEPTYRVPLAQYQNYVKILSATPTGRSYRWFSQTDIASNPTIQNQIQNFRRENLRQLIDAETMTDLSVTEKVGPGPCLLHRPLQPTVRILPTFRDITNPAMLQAIVQPNRIHSVDLKKKTAVVSYPTSLEKSTLSLSDLLALNPELLAAFLVQSSS
jgi:hypothetical protein